MMPKLSAPKACSRVSSETVPFWSSWRDTETALGGRLGGAREPIVEMNAVYSGGGTRMSQGRTWISKKVWGIEGEKELGKEK